MGEPLFFYRHYSAEAVQKRLLADRAFDVIEQVLWRKEGVPEAQARVHKIIPGAAGRWATCSVPLLPLLGRRAMQLGSVEDPGPQNVLGLALRRR